MEIPTPKFKAGDKINVIVREDEQVGFISPLVTKMQGWIDELFSFDHITKQHYYCVRLKGKKNSAEYEHYPEDELELRTIK
jgi:hypothetical protein